jgi:hypothetical protein
VNTYTVESPTEVWQLLETAGANEDAVKWAKPFGADLERMWAECCYGELMMGVSARFWVPPVLIGLTTVAIIRASMPPDLRMVDMVFLTALVEVEDWLSTDDPDEIGDDHVIKAIQDADRREDAISSMAGRAVHCAMVAMSHSGSRCSTYVNAAAAVAINCAKLRAAVVCEGGESSRAVLDQIQIDAMRDAAAVVRHYVPFEVLSSSVLGYALQPSFANA